MQVLNFLVRTMESYAIVWLLRTAINFLNYQRPSQSFEPPALMPYIDSSNLVVRDMEITTAVV